MGGPRAVSRAAKLAAGKLPVDADLVVGLIRRQFPQFAHLPVRPVEQDGWDNWTFHLGDRMKVRLPSAIGYVGQAEKEAHWLPRLAPHLPVAVPAPVAVGAPDESFPWMWSIYDWIDGEPVTRDVDQVALAEDVAGFLRALQRIDTTGGPAPGQHCWWRGGSVMERYGADARASIATLSGEIDADGAHAVLDAAEVAPFTGPPVWVHGDVAAGNLLMREGRLAAVIDFGGMAVGDPSTDLVIAWVVLTPQGRAAFRAAIDLDAGTWARARAWALWKAMLVQSGRGNVAPAERTPLEVITDVIAEHRAISR